MNALAWNFYDEVIHRLSKSDIELLKLTSGRWSSTAETHLNKRRELEVWLKSNSEGTKVGVKLYDRLTEVPFEIDFTYDRTKCICFSQKQPDETVKETMENFRVKTFPMIRSIAIDCSLDVITSYPHQLCDIIFDELEECRGLSYIRVYNYGEKCQEFIRRHIEFGNLKNLDLSQDTTIWPADFQDLIKVFVKSPKFRNLDIIQSNLRLDFDMVTYVFDRFFRGELTGFDLKGSPSFNINELKSFYPQFAVIPDKWPYWGSTAVWELPQTKKKLEVTVFCRQITVHCY